MAAAKELSEGIMLSHNPYISHGPRRSCCDYKTQHHYAPPLCLLADFFCLFYLYMHLKKIKLSKITQK